MASGVSFWNQQLLTTFTAEVSDRKCVLALELELVVVVVVELLELELELELAG